MQLQVRKGWVPPRGVHRHAAWLKLAKLERHRLGTCGRKSHPPAIVRPGRRQDRMRQPVLKIHQITARHMQVNPPIAKRLVITGTSEVPKNDQRKPEIR